MRRLFVPWVCVGAVFHNNTVLTSRYFHGKNRTSKWHLLSLFSRYFFLLLYLGGMLEAMWLLIDQRYGEVLQKVIGIMEAGGGG